MTMFALRRIAAWKNSRNTGEASFLRYKFGLIVSACLVCILALAAPVSGAGPGTGQAKDAAASQFAGAETCATCHSEVAKGFSENPHDRLALAHQKNGMTCEDCHGAGKAHVDGGGDVSKIFNPAKASAKEVDAHCLNCHQQGHDAFESSGHGEANVSCTACHSAHSGEDKDKLLKAEDPKLCFQCHAEAKAQFAMPFHHKVMEGQVKCKDCHDPHATPSHNGRLEAEKVDAVCTRCHAEKAGPFVHEHAVVKTEGCTSCHFPHGGANARLLNRANVNSICQGCHSPSPVFSTGEPIGPGHNLNQQTVACTSCHASVHGSNSSPIFLNTTE